MNPEFQPPLCPRCQTQLVKHKDKNYWVCPNWRPQNQGCEGAIYWPEDEREKRYPDVLFSIKIESKSNPGFFHQVKVYEDGSVYCGCVAASMAKFCDHKRKAVKMVEDLLEKIKRENIHGTKNLDSPSDARLGGNPA